MLLVAPTRKSVGCSVVNHLKHRYGFCFPFTAWKDHTDMWRSWGWIKLIVLQTSKLMKPIKITDLDSTDTIMAKLVSHLTWSTADICSICWHGHSGVNNQIHKMKAVCMSVRSVMECLQTYLASLPHLSPQLRHTSCACETHVASLSGGPTLHPFLSVLENDKKSASQVLDANDVIWQIFCKSCQRQ